MFMGALFVKHPRAPGELRSECFHVICSPDQEGAASITARKPARIPSVIVKPQIIKIQRKRQYLLLRWVVIVTSEWPFPWVSCLFPLYIKIKNKRMTIRHFLVEFLISAIIRLPVESLIASLINHPFMIENTYVLGCFYARYMCVQYRSIHWWIIHNLCYPLHWEHLLDTFMLFLVTFECA